MKNECQEWKHVSTISQKPNEDTEIIDLVATSFKPGCHIKKLSKTEYIRGKYAADGTFYSDGIVYTMQKTEDAMRNRRSLRQIFRALRQLIAANFAGGKSELFLTLTYAEQHNDPDKIYGDLHAFWKRLTYKYKNLKYIAIVEPHASGNFHIHLLVADTTGSDLYIPDAEIRKIWGYGITQTERLDDIDHMGAYFVAYFTNMELSPDEVKIYAADDDVVEKNGKSYIKGRRLDYYPENMRIYRHSKNCSKPVKHTGVETMDIIEGAKKTFEHVASWTENGNEYKILTAQYKRRKEPI